MKKIFLFVLFAALFYLLIGCNEPAKDNGEKDKENPPELSGYFKSSYGDGFEIINSVPMMFYQYDDAGKTLGFSGEIANHSDWSGESGFITIKIKTVGSYISLTVDKYYVVRWQSLTENSVRESAAYKLGGENTMDTIADAENEFTIANGYFAFFGDYIKQ